MKTEFSKQVEVIGGGTETRNYVRTDEFKEKGNRMTTNQKKAALKKIGITFHTQGGNIIRCEDSKQMNAIIEQPMHYSVDSIATAVKETFENLDVQDSLKAAKLL